jgi:hypothetical protein
VIGHARNARTHGDQQVAQIAASIREFGFTNPVLIDKEDGIIVGALPTVEYHCTLTQEGGYGVARCSLPLFWGLCHFGGAPGAE